MVKYGIEIFARVKPGKGRLGVRNLTCVLLFLLFYGVPLSTCGKSYCQFMFINLIVHLILQFFTLCANLIYRKGLLYCCM
jgi:hypothetical protein